MSNKFFLVNVSTRVQGVHFAKIDPEDAEKVLLHKWAYGKGGVRKKGFLFYVGEINTGMRLHRYLMNVPPTKVVDHIDGDPLNNCKANLRIATNTENCRNSRKRSPGTSKYKGVSWHAQCKKWTANISPNRRQIHLGLFSTEELAAYAYDKAALKHFGNFACLNFPI
jgi:hypothetical protein